MNKKKIDYDELRSAISYFDKAINALDSEIINLKVFIAKLKDDWDSEASKTYCNKAAKQISSLENAKRVIEELKKYSSGAIKSFELNDAFLSKFRISDRINELKKSSGL